MNGRFVVDNSVVITWCFGDLASDYADAVLDNLAHAGAVVPVVWPLEVVDILLAAERRKRLRAEASERFLALLARLPIVVDERWPSSGMDDLIRLGRGYGLSSYAAAYLDLALREKLPIATLDEKVLHTAQRLAIPIYEPQAVTSYRIQGALAL